jgi:hypothetical protein
MRAKDPLHHADADSKRSGNLYLTDSLCGQASDFLFDLGVSPIARVFGPFALAQIRCPIEVWNLILLNDRLQVLPESCFHL